MKKLIKFNRGISLLIVLVIASVTFCAIYDINMKISNKHISALIKDFYEDYSSVCVIPENIRNEYITYPEATYDQYKKTVKDKLSGYFYDELLLEYVTDSIMIQFDSYEYADLLYIDPEDVFVTVEYRKGKVYNCCVEYDYNYSILGSYDGTFNVDYVSFKKIDGNWYISDYPINVLNISKGVLE